MNIAKLAEQEKKVIYECMKAALEGPFFPDWEFQTLFGIDRKRLAAILADWPNVDDSDESVMLAINNSMGNLVGYPHGKDSEWTNFLSASRAEVLDVLRKWKMDRAE